MPNPVVVITDLVGAGILYSPLVPNLLIGAYPVAVQGNAITGHGPAPHSPAPVLLVTKNQRVRCGPAFIPLAQATDIASCGDIAIPSKNIRVILYP